MTDLPKAWIERLKWYTDEVKRARKEGSIFELRSCVAGLLGYLESLEMYNKK